MNMLMRPGLALMNGLTTPQKMVAAVAAFSVPIVIAVYVLSEQAGVTWQDPAALLIAGGYLLALYSTLGHHFQVATGFSGHGFQHAPVVGALIAEMIVEGSARTVAISSLSLERFASGSLIREAHVV